MKRLYMVLLFVLSCVINLPAQENLNVLQGHEEELGISEYMIYDFFIRQADDYREASLQKKSTYRTPEQWREYQNYVRENFTKAIGEFPEKTPLNVKNVGTLERNGYRIEKIIFESRPQFYVTTNVYVPTMLAGILPAIVSVDGHGAAGKVGGGQEKFVNLVKKGFIVLAYDPVGQGERSEYVDPETGQDLYRRGTQQHCQAGNVCFLTGTNLAQYRAWDGIRAIDYLLTRSDVDPERIGITGCSGGGTITTFITTLDDRLKASVPACYITRLRDRMCRDGEISHDAEQSPAGILKQGIDIADLLMPMAPRPMMICATQQDFFPFRGALANYNELQLMYADFNSIEKFTLAQADAGHGYAPHGLRALYAFMGRWLDGNDTDWREVKVDREPDSLLYCTQTGAVATSLGGETVWSINQKLAQEIKYSPAVPKNKSGFEAYRDNLIQDIQSILALPEIPTSPVVKSFGEFTEKGIDVEKVAVQIERDIWVPGLFYKKQGITQGDALMMVHEYGKTQLHDWAMEKAAGGKIVFTIDPRGVGETMDTYWERGIDTGYYEWSRDETSFTYSSFLLGRPMLGLRVLDVLTAANYLNSRPEVKNDITLYGKGHAGLVALFAGALDKRFTKVVCENALISYDSIINDKHYAVHLNNFLPDVIKHFDLPDVAAITAPRELYLINPVDSQLKVISKKDAEKCCKTSASVYKLTGNKKNFKIDNNEQIQKIL